MADEDNKRRTIDQIDEHQESYRLALEADKPGEWDREKLEAVFEILRGSYLWQCNLVKEQRRLLGEKFGVTEKSQKWIAEEIHALLTMLPSENTSKDNLLTHMWYWRDYIVRLYHDISTRQKTINDCCNRTREQPVSDDGFFRKLVSCPKCGGELEIKYGNKPVIKVLTNNPELNAQLEAMSQQGIERVVSLVQGQELTPEELETLLKDAQ